jgi:hypothetical protein
MQIKKMQDKVGAEAKRQVEEEQLKLIAEAENHAEKERVKIAEQAEGPVAKQKQAWEDKAKTLEETMTALHKELVSKKEADDKAEVEPYMPATPPLPEVPVQPTHSEPKPPTPKGHKQKPGANTGGTPQAKVSKTEPKSA